MSFKTPNQALASLRVRGTVEPSTPGGREESTAVHAPASAAPAIGALALGAVAIGALAVGALAIGRLAIGRARIRRVEIDELVVGKLRVTEELQIPPSPASEDRG
jgi:hypothetical protein